MSLLIIRTMNSMVLVPCLCLVALVGAQVPGFGPCPNIQPMQHFDVKKYLGVWYEQKRYFAIFEAGGICVTAQTSRYTSIKGEAKLTGKDGEGKLGVTFPSVGGFQAPYIVLGTDYWSYAVVTSCVDLYQIGNFQLAWILTRKAHPTEETLAKIDQVLSTSPLNVHYFRKTPQTCNY
ncbi:Apolipoprotein D [Blattella germanica]|nr:Apolipoprotein D [Blattella germanica]